MTDYPARNSALMLAWLSAFALCLVIALGSCQGGKRTTGRVEDFKRDLLLNTNALNSYVSALLQGKIDKIPGRVGFAPPANVQSSAFSILTVTLDANTNIYFVTDKSFTFANVGFIYQTHGAAFLGDGQEPSIWTNIPLAGKWHYYVSR